MRLGKRLVGALAALGAAVAGVVVVTSIFADTFSVPVSDLVVEGEIDLFGHSARFVARDGTMLSVHDPTSKTQRWYAFVPLIDPSSKAVNFTVYTITPVGEDRERLEDAPGRPSLNLSVGTSGVVLLPGDSARLKVTGLRSGKFSRVAITDFDSFDPSDLQRDYGSVGGGLCALTCGDFSVGANSVSVTHCGVCEGEGAPFGS
jgi:hypothetical protein